MNLGPELDNIFGRGSKKLSDECFQNVQDFLEGDNKSLESFEKEYEKTRKAWAAELDDWKKMIKEIRKNEKFLLGLSEESSQESSEESSEETSKESSEESSEE